MRRIRSGPAVVMLSCVLVAGIGSGGSAIVQADDKPVTPVEMGENGFPILPDPIPGHWLQPERHPRLVTTRDQWQTARHNAANTSWGRAYLEGLRGTCEPFAEMSEQELRALVPRPGSLFIAGGIGMDLDPVHQKRLTWRGWDHPFQVEAADGTIYPNPQWPDEGDGAVDPDTGDRYYFIALANGQITRRLTRQIIPQLGYVYSLTGEEKYARAAAVLLDELAAVYPTSHRGPLDYPQGNRLDTPNSAARWQARGIGGRLAAANYMAARQLTPLVHAADLIAPSRMLEQPSKASEGESIREHIIRNIFWDGATFQLGGARFQTRLTNGLADYIRGAATVGALLGVREFTEPLLSPEKGLATMLDNNVDRDGLYWESATNYSEFTRRLYLAMAEVIESMVWQGWPGVESIYEHPKMRGFLTETFNRLEVGGQLPSTGDSAPLTTTVDPMDRGLADRYRRSQLQAAWVQAVRGPDRDQAEQLLRDSAALDDGPIEPDQRLGCPMTSYFFVHHVTPETIDRVRHHSPQVDRFETESTFHGGKGSALLRGGTGNDRYGAQFMFGPMHVHGNRETLTWTFFARGSEWSMDPGYFNSHFRYGWTTPSISHQAIVVDETTYDTAEGGGYLRAWLADDEVQLAWAAHRDAYREQGVTRYERLIAQVHDPDTDHLGYWLDISRVEGGRVRDDSFHTQMRDIEVTGTALRDLGQASVGGDEDFSDKVRADYRLRGYEDKPFRWTPPGQGYMFLGRPRAADLSGTVNLRMTSPAFAEGSPTISTELVGEPGRVLILARGPEVNGRESLPSVPYVISRDREGDASVFAKVIRFVDEGGKDPIVEVRSVPATPEDSRLSDRIGRAFIVNWARGVKDLWIVADGAGQGALRVDADDLGEIVTDALVAVVRFDAAGEVQWIKAADASHLTAGGIELHAQTTSVEATVTGIEPTVSPIHLDVDWTSGGAPTVGAGHLVVIHPPAGQPTTWALLDADDNGVRLQGATSVLARTELVPDEDAVGVYHARTPISRFQSLFSSPLSDYAPGKAVFAEDRYLGRITELLSAADTSIRIEDPRGRPLDQARFEVRITEIGPGDRLVIPQNLHWRSSAE